MAPGNDAVIVAAMPPGPAATRARPKSRILMRPSAVRITSPVEIAMRHAFAVGARQGRGEIARRGQDRLERRSRGADLFAQRVPFDELGGDVQLALELLKRKNRADPRNVRSAAARAPGAADRDASRRASARAAAPSAQSCGRAVRRQVHASHAAPPDFADDRVGADRTRRNRAILLEELRNGFGHRLREKRPCARMMVEQRPNLRAHQRVIGDRLVEPAMDVRGLVLDGRLEQIPRAASLFRRHTEPGAPKPCRRRVIATAPGTATRAPGPNGASRWPVKYPSRPRLPRRSYPRSTGARRSWPARRRPVRAW